jgi:hypothetical protein
MYFPKDGQVQVVRVEQAEPVGQLVQEMPIRLIHSDLSGKASL